MARLYSKVILKAKIRERLSSQSFNHTNDYSQDVVNAGHSVLRELGCTPRAGQITEMVELMTLGRNGISSAMPQAWMHSLVDCEAFLRDCEEFREMYPLAISATPRVARVPRVKVQFCFLECPSDPYRTAGEIQARSVITEMARKEREGKVKGHAAHASVAPGPIFGATFSKLRPRARWFLTNGPVMVKKVGAH